jgi:hypothetical protein
MNNLSNQSSRISPENRLNDLNRQYKSAVISGYKSDELKTLKESIRKVQLEIERKVSSYY